MGNPNAAHYHLPIGVAVVGTQERAKEQLSTYTMVDCDASYGTDSRVAGLAYRVGSRAIRTAVRAGEPTSVTAELRAGLIGLEAARASRVRRVCLRTDNQVLAHFIAERWFPRKSTTYELNESIAALKARFDALAVAHVRTKEIAQVDRAAHRVRTSFERSISRRTDRAAPAPTGYTF